MHRIRKDIDMILLLKFEKKKNTGECQLFV